MAGAQIKGRTEQGIREEKRSPIPLSTESLARLVSIVDLFKHSVQ